MRFVPHKTETQQSIVMLHRTRELLVHQRIRLMNAFRAHLAEFGRISRPGLVGLKNLLKHIEDREQRALPKHARQALELLADQIQSSSDAISRIEADLKCWHRGNKQSRRLATIPGVGPITASYFAAIVPDPRIFHGSRQLAAWVGLVPRQRSSGGKTSLGRITRRGDRYLRSLLFVGARNVLTNYRTGRTPVPKFAAAIVTRKPLKVAAIAVANKMARIAWAVMSKKEDFSWSYVGSASLV
jgi:transposase